MLKLNKILQPRYLLVLLVLGGGALFTMLQATSNQCVSTTDGALTSSSTFGTLSDGSSQSSECGSNYSLNYKIGSGTSVNWSDSVNSISGTVEVENGGTLNLTGNANFGNKLTNSGNINLQAPQTPADPSIPISDFYSITNISGHTSEVGTASTFDVVLNAAPPVPATPEAPVAPESTFYTISNISGHTSEDGTAATFDVTLKIAPTEDVVVNVSSSNTEEATVNPAILTFTTGNWDTAQTVTVTGIDDTDSDGHQEYQISLSASGVSISAPESVEVVLHNLDDDLDLTVSLSSSNTSEAYVNPATLSFTEQNWNTPQTVTVTGVNDEISDGHQEYEVVLNAMAENGLVAHYKFNGNANDETTNANHAPSVDGSSYAADRKGDADKSLALNGTDDYLTIPTSTSLNMGEKLTMSAWVYPTDNDWSSIAMRGNYGYGFALSGDGSCGTPNSLVFWDQAVCGSSVFSITTYALNTWQHVAVTVEDIGEQLRIYFYLNGVEDGPYYSNITAIDNGGTSAPLYIGEQGECFCNYFGGNLDEFRLYNRALTETEVKHLYLDSRADVALKNLDDDFPDNPQVTVGGLLHNQGTVSLQNVELTLSGGVTLEDGNMDLSDSKVNLSSHLSNILSGNMASSTTEFKLLNDVSIFSYSPLSFQSLALNGNDLTLGSASTDLTISNILSLSNENEKIKVGSADLTLSGGLTLSAGEIEVDDGSISLGNVSTIASDAKLEISSGSLVLNAGLSVAGTLKLKDTSTITLNNNILDFSGGTAASGGVLETSGTLSLDGMAFDDKSTIKLTADTTLSSANPISLKTVELGQHWLKLGSETTDLTINEGLTINYPGENGLDTGLADLTLNGPVNVLAGGIMSSGGTVTYEAGSAGTTFADNETGMLLENTTLDLRTNLTVSWMEFTGASSLLKTNGNTLTLADGIDLGGGPEFDFTDVVTDSETYLGLVGDAGITKTGVLLFKGISAKGNTLTLNSAITSLTTGSFWAPNYGDNGTLNNSNVGALIAQGVDVTMTRSFYLEHGKLEMGGGTLKLEKGGGLGANSELDLSNSILELGGPFGNYDGGTFTTSASTLRLNANTIFEPGSAVTFDSYEPNGWGLLMHDNASTLTLGGDILLQPSSAALSSGFVKWYEYQNDILTETHLDNNSHYIGIQTDDANLTLSGDVTLKDNATIHSYQGDVSFNGNLTLDDGTVEIQNGALNLSGGNVTQNGKIKIGWNGNLNLQGNVAVAGTLVLDHDANVTPSDNLIDLSGGRLELSSKHNLDGITTSSATTLQINSYGHIFRTDYGSNTIGNLEMLSVQYENDNSSNNGTYLEVDNMSLNIVGDVQIEQGNINFNKGTLTLQKTVSADNASIRVLDGELILQDGLTFSNGNLYLENSVFKPKGTVSLADSWYGLNNSSVVLNGDTTLSSNGRLDFTTLDLNGNALTLGSNVTEVMFNSTLNIDNGDSLNLGQIDTSLNNSLIIESGGLLTSDNGSVQLSGALTLNGELVQGGGILNLIEGGTVGATGKLDMSDSELKLGGALNITGTLTANSGSNWSGWQG
ncbi:MAG: hypothetical protein ISR93_05665, partial [SAR324 cluster bacterium]|nr:hypothetical protein [SAR324 cluster bacterium]